MVVAQTDPYDEIIFMVFFLKDSPTHGPYLDEMPSILKSISDKTGIKFKYALNLDGGLASAFQTDFLRLKEAVRIGSFFCIK